MGFELTIYGINKSKQRDLQWYINHHRYTKEKNHLFELELYKPHELFDVLKYKVIDYKNEDGFDIQVIDENTLKELMENELRENNFEYGLTHYYKLMTEISRNSYFINNDKFDFYLILDSSF